MSKLPEDIVKIVEDFAPQLRQKAWVVTRYGEKMLKQIFENVSYEDVQSTKTLDWCIGHFDKVGEAMSSDTRDEFVLWLIAHPDKIDGRRFSRNSNKHAVGFMFEHLDLIDWLWFAGNPNDLVVDYLLKNEHLITPPLGFRYNTNVRALEYMCKKYPERVDAYRGLMEMDPKYHDLLMKLL
jgi:hypothetical protein